MVTVAPAAVRAAGRVSRASAARTRRKDLPGASGRRASARDSLMFWGGRRRTVGPFCCGCVFGKGGEVEELGGAGEGFDGVGAGKDEPVVGAEAGEGGVESSE